MRQHNIIILVAAIALLSACKTQERIVTVEKVRIDTTYITRHERDSIHIHDSIHVSEKGDTVRIDRWHTRWRDRWRYDTIYISNTDSIPVPYPVEVKVPAQLTWWQQTRLRLANLSLLAIALWLVSLILKRR